jgi:hypothetical protein
MGKELQGLFPLRYNHSSNPPAIRKEYRPRGAEASSFFFLKMDKKMTYPQVG